MEYQRSQVGSTSKTNCKMPQRLQVTAARLRVRQPGHACNHYDSCTITINLTWCLSSCLCWSNTRVVAQSVQENLPFGLTCAAVAAMEGLCVTLEAFQRRAWLNTLRP